MSSVAIVVPVNTNQLSDVERIGLKQISKVFKRDVFYVVPEGLEIENTNGATIIPINRRFFGTIKAHNDMLFSVDLYRLFQDYDYMLMHHMDAFCFQDNLDYFVNLRYDYIGAPWLFGMILNLDNREKVFHVGNGGLSLRNIDSMIRVLTEYKTVIDDFPYFEDIFLGSVEADYFKVAPIDVALSFSFECEPERAFRLNDEKLPFGCHAWNKYSLSFWHEFIEKEGYDLSRIEDKMIDKKCLIENKAHRLCSMSVDPHLVDSSLYNYMKKITNEFERKIVIWGAGDYGRRVQKILNSQNIDIAYFVDKDSNKCEFLIDNTEIKNISIIQNLDCVVIISVKSMDAIKNISNYLMSIGKEYRKHFISYVEVVEFSKY